MKVSIPSGHIWPRAGRGVKSYFKTSRSRNEPGKIILLLWKTSIKVALQLIHFILHNSMKIGAVMPVSSGPGSGNPIARDENRDKMCSEGIFL